MSHPLAAKSQVSDVKAVVTYTFQLHLSRGAPMGWCSTKPQHVRHVAKPLRLRYLQTTRRGRQLWLRLTVLLLRLKRFQLSFKVGFLLKAGHK